MKKALIVLGVMLIIAVVLGVIFRDAVMFGLMRFSLQPGEAFAATAPPAAPDYANEAHWAALPDRDDNADMTPEGVTEQQASAPVDVFFIHPTTYYTSDSWNQPLEHAQANEFTDEQVLPNQAGVFNSCCAVYAPRYRQATLYSFFDLEGDGGKAIDFAYEDVKDAFEYFLDHYSNDRPFIIAGHSQGGLHADRLLKDYITGTALEARMVAAYPVGYGIDGSNGVPVCGSASQTGCQVTWNTLAKGTERIMDTSSHICVNPLSWRYDDTHAGHAVNVGAVSFGADARLEPGVTDAQCVNGVLEVSEVRSENYPTTMFGEGNYHIYDYSLFHMNVRENAQARVAAFMGE